MADAVDAVVAVLGTRASISLGRSPTDAVHAEVAGAALLVALAAQELTPACAQVVQADEPRAALVVRVAGGELALADLAHPAGALAESAAASETVIRTGAALGRAESRAHASFAGEPHAAPRVTGLTLAGTGVAAAPGRHAHITKGPLAALSRVDARASDGFAGIVWSADAVDASRRAALEPVDARRADRSTSHRAPPPGAHGVVGTLRVGPARVTEALIPAPTAVAARRTALAVIRAAGTTRLAADGRKAGVYRGIVIATTDETRQTDKQASEPPSHQPHPERWYLITLEDGGQEAHGAGAWGGPSREVSTTRRRPAT